MKYFTFTARCALHNVDLEYIEPEGFEPDLMPIPREQDVAVNWGDEGKEYELDFAGRWSCPVFYKETDDVFDQDEEREHWEFVAQNSEVNE